MIDDTEENFSAKIKKFNLIIISYFLIDCRLWIVEKKGEQTGLKLSVPRWEDIGEKFGLGTKSVPPERRRKSTIRIV